MQRNYFHAVFEASKGLALNGFVTNQESILCLGAMLMWIASSRSMDRCWHSIHYRPEIEKTATQRFTNPPY